MRWALKGFLGFLSPKKSAEPKWYTRPKLEVRALSEDMKTCQVKKENGFSGPVLNKSSFIVKTNQKGKRCNKCVLFLQEVEAFLVSYPDLLYSRGVLKHGAFSFLGSSIEARC